MSYADLLTHIKNGETYVNIHTARSAAGEIRGDLK
jgi:CHRD domain